MGRAAKRPGNEHLFYILLTLSGFLMVNNIDIKSLISKTINDEK